jgi:simple sugar transport system substrate-binding protein
MFTRRAPTGLVAVAVCAFTVSACGVTAVEKDSSSSTSNAASAPSAGSAGSGEGPKIFVVGGKSDDPFWSRVKRGADDAAKVVKAQGGSVTWLAPKNYDNLGPDAAKLIDTAVSQGADGVVGPDWVPEAQDASFKKVVGSSAPVVIFNAGGIQAAQSVGALNYGLRPARSAARAGAQPSPRAARSGRSR